MRGHAATVASLVFLHSSSGLAQDDAGQKPVDVVVRGSSKESLGFRRTRAVTDLNKDDLSETPATSVPDALRRAPGVAIQQTTPGQGTVYVRGMSSREVLVLVDGVRLNGSLFRAGNNPYLGLVDPYSVREALVLRGTSSVEHGSDALGGVIDLRTSLPGYSLADGGTTRLLSLQHLWTNGPGSASRVAAEHACGNWAGQVGFTSIAQGDIRPGEGEHTPVPSSYWGLDRTPGEPYTPDSSATQHGTGFRSYFGDMALRRRVGQGSEVVVRAQVGYRPELLRYDQVTPRFKREYPAQAESAATMSRTMLSLEWAKRWSDKPIDELRITVSWQQLAEATVRRDLDESCPTTH